MTVDPTAEPAIDNPIIVALDVGSAEEAVRLAKAVAPHVGAFKIGLGLLMGPGPTTVAALRELGRPVFVDAKLHDIPTQVEAAAQRLGRHGARWVTAHVSGGSSMLEAAVSGLNAAAIEPVVGILGVTVLTSLDAAMLAHVGMATTPGKLVSKMARVAARAGCEGVVCSPQEIGVVKQVAPGLLAVTPGIRPAAESATSGDDDQARTATPGDALQRGANYLVIGRPITRAPDPVAAAAAIAASLT